MNFERELLIKEHSLREHSITYKNILNGNGAFPDKGKF